MQSIYSIHVYSHSTSWSLVGVGENNFKYVFIPARRYDKLSNVPTVTSNFFERTHFVSWIITSSHARGL